jgi:streptomycin 6-kinase
MAASVDVPEAVRRKADALGDTGARWLADLRVTIDRLTALWDIEVGDAIEGGSSAFVAAARTGAGEQAVLKVAIPDGLDGNSPFARELHALQLGAGHGYVRVLRAEPAANAVLLERLGRPLAALGLPVDAQIDSIAATVMPGWTVDIARVELRTGREQAEWLSPYLRTTWDALDQPCAPATVERAEHCAQSRADAFDAASAVLVHGDAHPHNLLEVPQSPGSFALVDPDAMASEPAHDLAIPLRDWTAELLTADNPVAMLAGWCARFADLTGVDADPIWEWAFLERVSTGLFMCRLGDPAGAGLLAVADRLAGAGV